MSCKNVLSQPTSCQLRGILSYLMLSLRSWLKYCCVFSDSFQKVYMYVQAG